jgi:hypothetical protein
MKLDQIKANELRIGNWISDSGGKIWQIDFWESANKVSSKYPSMGIHTVFGEIFAHPFTEEVEYLQPILITEEILLKCGLIKENEFIFVFPNTSFRLWGFAWTIQQFLIGINWVDINSRSIKYLHQLQNIYFSLTQEELIFKPN